MCQFGFVFSQRRSLKANKILTYLHERSNTFRNKCFKMRFRFVGFSNTLGTFYVRLSSNSFLLNLSKTKLTWNNLTCTPWKPSLPQKSNLPPLRTNRWGILHVWRPRRSCRGKRTCCRRCTRRKTPTDRQRTCWLRRSTGEGSSWLRRRNFGFELKCQSN